MPTWNPCSPSRCLSMRPWNSLSRWPLEHFQGLHRLLFNTVPQGTFSQPLTKGWLFTEHVNRAQPSDYSFYGSTCVPVECLKDQTDLVGGKKMKETSWHLLGCQGIPDFKCYWAFLIPMKVYLLRYKARACFI